MIRMLARYSIQIAFQRLDEGASGVISPVTSSNGRRQRALHPTKISNPRPNVEQVNGSKLAGVGATFVPACREVEQRAHLLDRETEPRRVCWRLFGLSHAAIADCSNVA